MDFLQSGGLILHQSCQKKFFATCLTGLMLSGIFCAHPFVCSALTINPIYDASITSDPNAAAIENTLNATLQKYDALFSDPITVTLKFQESNTGLGSSQTFVGAIPYTLFTQVLAQDATTANDAIMLAHLPATPNNPVNGNPDVLVTSANLRALGFIANPPGGAADSTISLNMSLININRTSIDPSKYDLMAVASHEIDEALGFGSALNGSVNGGPIPTGPVFSFDLLRYDQNGARSFNTAQNSQAYLSLDGTTQLARFNQTAGGDFGDFFSDGPHTPEVQDAFGTPGSTPDLDDAELTGLDVIGYDPVIVPEPATFTLLGVGIVALLRARRRRIFF